MAIFLTVVNVLLGIASLISLFFAIYQAGETVVNIGEMISGSSSEMLTIYDALLDKLGINFGSLISGVDSLLAGVTSSVCTPECTLSYLLNSTGIAFFLRGCLYQVINVACFRFAIFQVKMVLLKLSSGFGGTFGKVGKK